MSRVDDEDTTTRLLQHCRELELMLALVVVKFGEPADGGFRLVLNDEDVLRLLRQMGTMEPIVSGVYDSENLRYVMSVL